MAPRKAQTSIAVKCQQGHRVDCSPADLALTWSPDSIVVGVEFHCPGCDTRARATQPPETLALLAASGVALAAVPLSPADVPPAISDHRRVVSFKIMLDLDGARQHPAHLVADPRTSSRPVNGDGPR